MNYSNAKDESDRNDGETSNIDISNLNLHQVTESAHEGNSPITEQVVKKRKNNNVDINQIDTSALDTSVQESALKNPINHTQALPSGTQSGISKRTFNFSVTKDKPNIQLS